MPKGGLTSKMDSDQENELAPVLGDLSQGEKLSEIKPPLVKLQIIFRESYSLVARKGNSFM